MTFVDSRQVAKYAEAYLRLEIQMLEAGHGAPPHHPDHTRLIRVLECATVMTPSENEVVIRIPETADAHAESYGCGLSITEALERADRDNNTGGQFVQNTPVEWLLAW
jgi:hypothetical protein